MAKVGGKVAKAGAVMATAFVGAGIAIGTKAVKTGADFETQMNNVSTLLDGDVAKRMAELGENVKKMSISTNVSTDLLTDGLYQVISAFGDTADASKILEVASKGAKAGNATVTDSVNLLSAVTKGYGDTSAEAASKASDLAFLTVKLGQTTFPELASSMGKVIPLAGAMKVSQEELFGAMATLTGVTGGTAEVSTQLRATFQSFMKPSKQLQAALESMGYATGAQMLESEGLAGSLDLLKKSVGNDDTAFANLFSSVEAGTAVLALTGTQADNFTEKTKAMNDAVGSTEEAFKKQNKGFAAMVSSIKNSVNVAMISLGEKLLPSVNNIVESIATAFQTGDWSNVGKVLSEELTGVIKGLVDIIPQIMPVVVDLIDGLAKAFVESVPIVAPFVFEAMLTLFNNLLKLLKDNAPALIGVAKDLILMLMRGLRDSLPLLIDTAVEIILSLVDSFIDMLPEFIAISIEIIQKLVEGLLEALPSLIDAGIELLISLTDALIEMMPLLIETAIQLVMGLIEGLLNAREKIMESAPKLIEAIVTALIDNLPMIIDASIEIILAIMQGLMDQMPLMVESGVKVVGSLVGGLIKGLPQIWKAIPKVVEGIWDGIKNVNWGSLGGDVIKGITSGIKDKAKNLVSSVGGFVKGIFGGGETDPEDLSTQPLYMRGGGYATSTSYVPETGMYRVGEDRPEDVVLPKGSQVFPISGNRGSGSKGNQVIININDAKVFNENDARKLGQLISKHWQLAGVGKPV